MARQRCECRAAPGPRVAAARAAGPPTIRSRPTCTPTRRPRSCRPEAVLASLGCGNPTALAELREGETVLDLGSGGGIDVLLSAKRVGPDRQGLRPRHDRRDARPRSREPAEGRCGQRRVPAGGNRIHPASRQLGGRDHLQLRRQPVGRQAEGPLRGVPGAQARAAGSPCRTSWSAERCRPRFARAWSCGSAAWPVH